jgi:hypothetical protein
MMLQRWLESLGYEVLLAANGVEALVQLKNTIRTSSSSTSKCLSSTAGRSFKP